MHPFPYAITTWNCGYRDLAQFKDFDLALACYAALKDETKQLVNRDRQDVGCESGLAEDEREQVLEAT